MTPIYEEIRRVSAEEIDQLGHVNNIAYLRWAVEAAARHSVANGWPFQRYERIGAGWVVRMHHITYWRPAFEGDDVRIRTWIADFSRAKCRRMYRIERCDEDAVVLASAQTEWVFIDFAKQTPRRIPAEVADSFAVLGENPIP